MNFYSDDIINKMVDESSDQELFDKMQNYYDELSELIRRYSYRDISPTYSRNLLSDLRNKVVFRSMGSHFDMYNCPSMMIYTIVFDSKKKENVIYIFFICTKKKYMGMGYANSLLDDFIDYIKQKYNKYANRIILSSLYSSVTFYEKYGFSWCDETILDHKRILQFEKYEKDALYVLMELKL